MLKYKENGQFKIIQFTDVHLGDFPFSEVDQKTLKSIEKAVRKESPDLLIFTGDNIYSLESHGVTHPLINFKEFLKTIDLLEIPLAITFGNHDTESKVKRDDLNNLIETNLKNKAKIMHAQTIEGRKNFVLEIYDKYGNSLENLLYILDSGDYDRLNLSFYAYILESQIEWFRKTSKEYKTFDQKRNLVFFHIPLIEYWISSLNIIDGSFEEDMEENLSWMDDKLEIKIPFKKGICSPDVNSGFFLELLKKRDIWGTFCGHDHDNDFVSLYKGTHLSYGRSSGYNSYGKLKKGYRVIKLLEGGKIETNTADY